MNTEINISLPCEINEILTRIMEHGGEAYIVGGAIRDALLGRPINDWDIATSLKPDDIERLFSHTRTISVGKKVRHRNSNNERQAYTGNHIPR